ncbi:unnamed protein product [Mytilus edulis]|uniref:Exonuclease domain-containing protein n=1 Tax=Mytilus edulis TaxID=6550 RepID=A0A8S3PQL0_MYTED|nr:unnamed protein product [Mytilus edulis]
MCWQKRGSGRSYSSHSGVGSVIGQNTGKVLNFKVCSDHCRICLKASQLGKEPENHECQKNWNKSPKAMEAHTGAELLKTLEDIGGTQVGVLVMDDDSATLSQVKERLGHPVEKWSDINHSRKSVGNSMYNTLQKKHKSLTTTVIKYFQKCFSYAISQNKNQENALKETLISIVPHAFGQHEKCGNWCKADNDNFSFKSLPGGKALSGDDLYNDLYIVFETMSNNSHKLAPGGSTKDVESLNGIFASKAPKRICYSASESLKNRVSATVAQKNIGYHYISELHLEAGLSPNKITKKQSECLSKERKRQLIYNQQPEVKRRKIKTNNEKKTEIAKKEKVEGTTYKSDVGFSLVTEINNIPGIRYRPNIETVTNFDGNFAVFDLETSSLQEDCEILQIACKFNDNEFSCYIQPTKPISKMSSAVTGLTNEGGVLFHHGKPIRAINREAAFQNFVIWLSQYKPVILIGHNAKLFDSKRLILNIKNFTCFAEFKTVVKGFVDTLPLFKKQFPGFPNYKQTTVYENVCGGQFDAHNAIGDVSALNCILEKSSIDQRLFTATPDDHTANKRFVPTLTNEMDAIRDLQDCAVHINTWMNSNKLKMNNAKTEFILFGSRHQLSKCQTKEIIICGDVIKSKTCIRYLGAFLDETLNFKDHITKKCKTAMMNYYKIKCIRSYLSKEATETLVLSLVISHLDYCNVILFGISQTDLYKLQRIQNMCAKLVLNRSKYDSAKQALFDLHWLPIKARITFKILTYMYNCHVGNAPSYLINLLNPQVSKRSLRSSESSIGCYAVPYNKKKTFSDRSFSTIGPKLWNELGTNVRNSESLDTFKCRLKTLYFENYFELF